MNRSEFCIMKPNTKYSTRRFEGSERHEIFFGSKNRTKSIEDGLVVFLTHEDHRGTYGAHGKNGHEFDLYLKQLGQKRWMEFYNKTTEQFIKRYGKNYL